MKNWGWLAVGLWMVGVTALAADKADFIRDADAADAVTAPAYDGVGSEAEALTSLKGVGRVKIGGGAQVRYLYTRVKAAQGTFAPGTGLGAPAPANTAATFHSNGWENQAAYLFFDVQACDNGKLTIKLDIDDAWNNNGGSYDADDFLEEVYFTLDQICGTGFGSKVGKMEIPFGMDKDVLMISPYLHANGESFLQGGRNGRNTWGNFYGFYDNGQAFSWQPNHSIEYDNRFAWVPYWKNDQWLIEATVFQDNQNGRYNGRYQTPTGALRDTNDPGVSFAGRVTWTPIEDLKFMASGITFQNRHADDVTGKDRSYASSLAADWTTEVFCRKLNLFAEWQHAWRPDFVRGADSDDIHAGASIKLTEAITLLGQYEWLRGEIDTGNIRRTLQRAIGAVQYQFAGGMYCEVGYQREWGRIRDNGMMPWFGGQNSAYADTLYCGMGFSF